MTKLEERLRKYTLNPFEKVEVKVDWQPNKNSEAGLANVVAVKEEKAEEGA